MKVPPKILTFGLPPVHIQTKSYETARPFAVVIT